MRDPKRIQTFCNGLAKIWEQVPDWRFGQLMANIQRSYAGDIFFLEDDKMFDIIEKFIKAYVRGDIL